MKREAYPTDLPEEEGPWLAPLLPRVDRPGRPRKHPWRAILNAIFSGGRTGCQGRLWPQGLPTWKTTSPDVRLWRKAGTGAQMHQALREPLRGATGRHAQPRAGRIDSQRVQTTGIGGERGYEGAKQIKGRPRHGLVDTPGLVRTVTGPPAPVMDRDGGMRLRPPAPMQAALPRLTPGWLAAG